MMPVFRIWHGETSSEKSDDFTSYVKETGIPDIRSTPGNLGLLVLRGNEGDRSHFWFISAWENMESVKAFAGEEPEKPWYYPRDKELLLQLEDRVVHCEAIWADFLVPSASNATKA